MGVYIPNMEKPIECKECQWHLDFYIEDEQVGGLCTITEKDDRENTCPLIEIPQEDEEAVSFIVRMRKAMREGKSLREFLGGEMANNTRTERRSE